jgi:hypothetical protein
MPGVLLFTYAFSVLLIVSGCGDRELSSANSGSGRQTTSVEQRVAEIRSEIEAIESVCVPEKGTPREDVEKIFGSGNPLPPHVSKLPYKGEIPKDSPRRAYDLCPNGTLLVHYDRQWNVMFADYLDPYSVKGRPFGLKVPPDELLRELEPRLRQMRQILEVYKKKSNVRSGDAGNLKGDFIFSWKPNPSHLVGHFNEHIVRQYIRYTVEVARHNGSGACWG